MVRLFFLILGFALAVTGGVTLVAFLNLLTAGYGFSMYMSFVVKRVEFYLFLIGILIILISITFELTWRKKRKRNRTE